ncbi:transglutaminase TgpA family protein [Jeotgalibacillus soli]|uniref:Transglutaminase-like domain-containing protein n=1 Tax=Jeotgalibacillus soli TaxID=889306 RepID=A0A0C2W1Z6_9BACL|nr:transglutaminaseTgpA domain-containing protein [Jeotgalibacillus soli]KIL50651.1 hypothetical protein KP78_06520 [Jeotgalibacillus soli]
MIQRIGWEKLSMFILYCLSFFLLWEWIRPLNAISDTGYLHYFVIFIGLSFLLYFFQVDWRISNIVKVLFVVFVLRSLHFPGPLFGGEPWISSLILSLWDSVVLTIEQNWNNISNVYRSFLFFILLWLTTYLVHYWIAVRKQLFLFYVFTIIYVALLDTFSPYSGDSAIIRIIIIGFLLMGLLALQRIVDKEKLQQSGRQYRKWLVPLVIMVAFSSVAAYAAPKAEPLWPDPVPFIQSFAGDSGTGPRQIGYGMDDSALGGSFIGDDTKVFDVITDGDQYWRIETKDLYTGKGWENSEDVSGAGPAFVSGDPVPLNLSVINEESETKTATLDISLEYTHLVYPYNPMSVESDGADLFIIDEVNEKMTSYEESEPTRLSQYEWAFREPRYSLTALRETVGQGQFEGTPELDQYLQLPDNLPDRVRELAAQITADQDNWYDKANAVESYFANGEFTYDQTDVAVPQGNQDYVDQFLFETQRGYCDNFSTSMVVLLRSVDIPARWVKGYTEGEAVRSVGNGQTEYTVTNNNAHSWVEVFFPELGWVPFEPTIGFSNNVSLDYDLELETESEAADTPEQEQQEVEQPSPIPEEEEPTDSEDAGAASSNSFWMQLKQFFDEQRSAFIISGLLFAAAGIALYRMRLKWMPYVLILYYSKRNKQGIYPKAYLSLLKQLDRYGLKRKDTQTLRSYAKEIDNFFGSTEMSKLTSQYERILYRQDSQGDDWSDMRELWENLIKRTTG